MRGFSIHVRTERRADEAPGFVIVLMDGEGGLMKMHDQGEDACASFAGAVRLLQGLPA
ncbi:hypothetical protein [Candidatus Nitrospira bockiana]